MANSCFLYKNQQIGKWLIMFTQIKHCSCKIKYISNEILVVHFPDELVQL